MTADSDISETTPTARALAKAARVGRLVVASDFDGTLSPFVDDPSTSRLAPGALDSLRALASLPRTSVALLSGRDRATLSACSGVPLAAAETGIELVGAHGAEWEGAEAGPDEAKSSRLAEVTAALEAIAAPHEGAFVERKPTSSALHVRRIADPAAGDALLDAALRGPGALPGVHVTAGKAVLEIAVREASKGAALSALRERDGADAVVFFGDDVTDEKGFAVLGTRAGGDDGGRTGHAHGASAQGSALDVGVKVGDGESAAAYRLGGIPEVVDALGALYASRVAPR